jgi:sortase (surface protein transpeptidase)
VIAPVAPPTTAPLAVPAALTSSGLSLRSGPLAVPLVLEIPSLGVRAPVVGVGITAKDVMDAPMGPAKDPVWQQAFWYRGSAVPGAPSTALIAGHIDDPLGRYAIFGHIDRLRPGDLIVVHDNRSGLDVRFSVTESTTYSLAQTAEPAVLTQIYGVGPVAGTWPQPSTDGLAHLTLITCAGTFRNGTHDHRLVVYAVRIT